MSWKRRVQEDKIFTMTGDVALVIGAASGIGRAIAQGFSRAGAMTVCADTDLIGLADTVSIISDAGGASDYLELDVTSEASIEDGFRYIISRHARIDVAVITPGKNIRKCVVDFTTSEFDMLINLNLKGTFLAAQAAAKVMKRQEQGNIILLSSIRAEVMEPGMGVYGATKAGIVQIARALAAELGPFGIRVNCLAPGIVHTPLSKVIWEQDSWREAYAQKTALGRWAQPEELVGPAIFLASPASSYVTGAVLFVDGGWTAIDGRFNPPSLG